MPSHAAQRTSTEAALADVARYFASVQDSEGEACLRLLQAFVSDLCRQWPAVLAKPTSPSKSLPTPERLATEAAATVSAAQQRQRRT